MSDRDSNQGPSYTTVIAVSLLTSAVVSVLTTYALDQKEMPWRAQEAAEPDTVEVPSVVSMPSSTAGELLQARGLRLVVEGERPDATEAAGVVVEQSPLPDSRVDGNSEVRVTLSTGPAQITVPSLLGRPLADARDMLEEAGLEVGEVTEGGEGEAGAVTAADPSPGTEVTAGDRVALTVAAAGTVVPDLTGKRLREARTLITEAGLSAGRVRWRYDEDRGPYVVLAQSPEPGAQAEPGQAIELTVNEGD